MWRREGFGLGVIDAVVESKDELVSAAKQGLDNKDDEAARTQPWIPGVQDPGR